MEEDEVYEGELVVLSGGLEIVSRVPDKLALILSEKIPVAFLEWLEEERPGKVSTLDLMMEAPEVLKLMVTASEEIMITHWIEPRVVRGKTPEQDNDDFIIGTDALTSSQKLDYFHWVSWITSHQDSLIVTTPGKGSILA